MVTINTMKTCFVKLQNRGLIHIEGEDRHAFLQGLITNNMDRLSPQNPLYACLLTPQGKFLHDFFVIEGDGFILLDCEGGARALDLYKRLNMYRLHSKVQISVEDENDVYAIFGADDTNLADPRHPGMGARSFERPESMEERPFEEWDRHRIALTIPDGSRDMVPAQSTLLECHIDTLNGIDFKKGCYVGQELTARMHHRGLAKKHLYTIEGDNLPESGEDIMLEGKLIGQMRSKCGNIGLALLKDAMIPLPDHCRITAFRPAAGC